MRTTSTILFEKEANLLPFYETQVNRGRWNESPAARCGYSRNRTVTLVLAFGINEKGVPVANIRCPINPLPVKGWFEYASRSVLLEFLTGQGWRRSSVHQSTLRLCGKLYSA